MQAFRSLYSRAGRSAGGRGLQGLPGLIGFEFLVVIAAAAWAIGLCAPSLPPIAFKAGFVEVLSLSLGQRNTLLERYALTGAWAEAQAGTVPDAPTARPDPLTAGVRGELSGAEIVYRGRLRGLEESFQVTLRPAVPATESGWTVQWLCGTRRVPEGWTAPPATRVSYLPPAYLPAECREGLRR